MSSFVVYILRTCKNTLYTGQTNNLERRLKEHRDKKRGAKYTRSFDNFELVYQEEWRSRSGAMTREAEIKRMTKSQKENLVLGGGSGNRS